MNEDRDSRPKVQIPSAVATPTIPSKEASNSAILTSQSPKQAYPSILAEPDLIIIEKRSGWHWIHWKDLWRHRELLYFLVWRDVKVRYKQTALGVAWAVLQPLAMMLVLSLFFGRYAEMPSAKIPYPLFLFAGLLPWFFFANAIGSAGQSVVGNQNLITKVYFPRLLIPVGAVTVCLVDFAIGFVMLILMMMGYGISGTWTLLGAPIILFGLVTASLGVGTWLSALTVAYRDFRYVVPFMIQLWMFSTPSVYMQTSSILHPRWSLLLPLNPAHGLITNFRAAVLGLELDTYSLTVSFGVSLLILLGGCFYFQRVERSFADVI
jgi:lipopolysaccharide transport system permease protein